MAWSNDSSTLGQLRQKFEIYGTDLFYLFDIIKLCFTVRVTVNHIFENEEVF